MIELSTNTNTAERRIGAQREVNGTIMASTSSVGEQTWRERYRVSARGSGGCRPALPHPGLRDRSATRGIVHDEDELVLVVAVEGFDVDAGFRHAPANRAE